jgi:hypothetical protein
MSTRQLNVSLEICFREYAVVFECVSSVGFAEEVLERSVFNCVSLPANKVEFRSKLIRMRKMCHHM